MTTTTPTPSGDRRKSRKGLLGLVAIGTAGALVAGLGFAYFSDVIEFGGGATAGTLYLTGDLSVYQNGTPVPGGVITNLNPGDVVTFTGDITNAGTKSAYVRSVINVDAPGVIGEYLYVYADGAPDQATLIDTDRGALTGTPLVGGALEASSATTILSGSEEPDGATDMKTVSMVVYFAKEAPNQAQGLSVDVTGTVEAVQFRNMPNPPEFDAVFTAQAAADANYA